MDQDFSSNNLNNNLCNRASEHTALVVCEKQLTVGSFPVQNRQAAKACGLFEVPATYLMGSSNVLVT